MTNIESIYNRKSRRTYLDTPIDSGYLKLLQQSIDLYNEKSGLRICLALDGSAAFDGLMKSYGLFSGVRSLFAMVGKKDDLNLKEKVGYYGEMLVLESTKMNMGTCWVGGTFDKKSNIVQLADDEVLVCVIPVGNTENLSFKEKMVHQMVARKSKTIDEMLVSDVKPPNWLIEGLKAVQKAPSAVNHQPVRFEFNAGVLKTSVIDDGKFNLIDFGIAKAHFEIVTGGKFKIGNDASFKR